MKKSLVLVFGLTLLLTGCGKKEVVDYEKIWQGYATTVVDKYVFPNWSENYQFDNFIVEMSLLRNINNNSDGNFDLEVIKSCSEESQVKVVIDKETKTITNYEFTLDCE